jgi:tetratricopeptide (TPR) repeat protein
MKATTLTLVVILLAALAAGHTSAAQDTTAFERALLLEEAQAQFGEAISLYEQIVKESSDPALRARAQLHIGICYEKLGREEARRAYQKVLDEYPSQAIVASARERLAAIRMASRASERGGADLVLQQVWPNPLDTMGAPSPDGRYISYVAWEEAAVAIRDLETGDNKVLDSTAGTWEGEWQWAESPLWSPDGKRVSIPRQSRGL